MATKDERPGLLSKVAMFVRNPTKDWSELDQVESTPAESGYDRNALKTMIERKRQNDFVRKREFDQLRKLRNRAPGTPISAARPSFFQTSLPMEDEGRSVTLKKIDEIEAQMSKQWWKGKQAGARPDAAAFAAASSAGAGAGAGTAAAAAVGADAAAGPGTAALASAHDGPASVSSLPFATTILMAGEGRAGEAEHTDFATTQTVSDLMALPTPPAQGAQEPLVATDFGFSMTDLGAAGAAGPDADPELEEAAIRFANGDDAGTEQCLLAALRADLPQPQAARVRIQALLDFYRVCHNREGFSRASREFALFLDQPAIWNGPLQGPEPHAASIRVAAQGSVFTWQSGAELHGESMEQLRSAMLGTAPPWVLDWSALRRVNPSALPLMDDLFASLCEETVSLRFFSADCLVQALRVFVPTGDRAADDLWWRVRLNVLRVLRMQDDFELAALDYCVNMGVPPPVWTRAKCNCQDMSIDDLAIYTQAVAQVQAQSASAQADADASVPMQLSGSLLGDVTAALAQLDAAAGQQMLLVVHCDALERVDFAAAGSILNWVVMRQAEGRQVRFQNLHWLVAAFFSVIGIHAHAQMVAGTR